MKHSGKTQEQIKLLTDLARTALIKLEKMKKARYGKKRLIVHYIRNATNEDKDMEERLTEATKAARTANYEMFYCIDQDCGKHLPLESIGAALLEFIEIAERIQNTPTQH